MTGNYLEIDRNTQQRYKQERLVVGVILLIKDNNPNCVIYF